jgi:Kdo2-lipid IVA lauroyltransferase/acyltransferase
MQYIALAFLRLCSLLPFFVLYGISNFVSFMLCYVVKYRKAVVLYNLGIAFPEKTEAERKKIAFKFYRYFTDTFLETLKMLSLSNERILKRVSGNCEILKPYIAQGKNINLMAGHQFNWEFGNHYFRLNLDIPFVGIYMPVGNQTINEAIKKMRGKNGTILIGANEFKNKMHGVFKDQYMMGLAADQNPGVPQTAYWVNFFNKPTPFITGPEKGALRTDAVVAYVQMVRKKRGHYGFEVSILSDTSSATQKGELTVLYKNAVEKAIKSDPPNYLWSHKRFKYNWNAEYAAQWIDGALPE